jgi:hypothetical protein
VRAGGVFGAVMDARSVAVGEFERCAVTLSGPRVVEAFVRTLGRQPAGSGAEGHPPLPCLAASRPPGVRR